MQSFGGSLELPMITNAPERKSLVLNDVFGSQSSLSLGMVPAHDGNAF
tara:strand:- start:1451 stop:1594 length:144 start_codon:yes stop_codon:yes gene_type:complete